MPFVRFQYFEEIKSLLYGATRRNFKWCLAETRRSKRWVWKEVVEVERRSVDSILRPRALPRTNLRAGVKSTALILSLIVSAYVTVRGLGAPSHSWLAWVALLPLFAAIRVLRPVRAMLCGALWGFCLQVFAEALVGTGFAEGILSFALLTAIPAIYCLFGSLLTRRIGFSPLVLGVGWMGVALAVELLSLHDGLLSGTQGSGTLLHWVGGVLGYVLAAFLVAFVSSVLLVMLSAVRVTIPRRPYPTEADDDGTCFVPQTFPCFPLFSIPFSFSRAPPDGAMSPT